MTLLLSSDVALYFRNALRDGRAVALRDSENFGGIVFVVERLGSYLTNGRKNGLGPFAIDIRSLVALGSLVQAAAGSLEGVHSPFDNVYEVVRSARNSAVHEGAFARHLTTKSVELALMIEDALTQNMTRIGDFMVQGAITASPWQPVSLIRQIMLSNSFSFLPVRIPVDGTEGWWLISDYGLASYLRGASNPTERKNRLAEPLEAAVRPGGVKLERPLVCRADRSLVDVLELCNGLPVLVCAGREQDLAGIVTPYDLL